MAHTARLGLLAGRVRLRGLSSDAYTRLLRGWLVFSLAASQSTQAETLDEFFWELPVLICHDNSYRTCRGEESIAKCSRGLAAHRNSCSGNDEIKTMKELNEATACLIVNHAGVKTVDEFEANCIGIMDINLTAAKRKVDSADPAWVDELLR